MSVMRVHKNGNFTVMSNYHFKEKDMSLKSKGLLSLMLSLPPDWDYSVAGLVKLSKDGKDSVMSALGELEKFGYLHRKRVKDEKGQFAGVEYNIFEEPQQNIPISENPTSANSISENPQQLITKELKTNELNTNYIYINNLINEISDFALQELVQEYVELRKNINAELSHTGLKFLLARSQKLANGDRELERTMWENALINNYKNIYLPNDPEANNELAEKKRFYNL